MKNVFSFPFFLALLIALWTFGFSDFVVDLTEINERTPLSDMTPADAIIVLTGGSERVATGIELLQSGAGKKLFISGVHKNLSLDTILAPYDVAAELRACCIALGYQAGSTVGNAEETRQWMAAQGYHSLRLVTANYHMPRSLLLFHNAMPDIDIIPHPVTPDKLKLDAWWKHPAMMELLASEYSKYLIASFELWISRL